MLSSAQAVLQLFRKLLILRLLALSRQLQSFRARAQRVQPSERAAQAQPPRELAQPQQQPQQKAQHLTFHLKPKLQFLTPLKRLFLPSPARRKTLERMVSIIQSLLSTMTKTSRTIISQIHQCQNQKLNGHHFTRRHRPS
jgi:hypothetical protein